MAILQQLDGQVYLLVTEVYQSTAFHMLKLYLDAGCRYVLNDPDR